MIVVKADRLFLAAGSDSVPQTQMASQQLGRPVWRPRAVYCGSTSDSSCVLTSRSLDHSQSRLDFVFGGSETPRLAA